MTKTTDSPYRVNLDGESTGPEGQYLVWYSSSQPEVETAESLQEALSEARMYESSEYAMFGFIEGPAGIVPKEDVQRWLDKLDAEESERWRREREEQRGRVRYHVMVRTPDGEREASYETTFSETAALSYARDLNLPGRVKVYSRVEGEPRSWDRDSWTVILDYGDAIPPAEEGPQL